MLIALLSDIHANSQALSAVVKDAHASNSEVQFWCLGDIFGRGPDPFSVWFDLKNLIRPRYWIRGNHEYYLVGGVENSRLPNGSMVGDINQPADWEAIRKQQELLRHGGHFDSVKSAFENMPAMVSPFPGVYLAHGSFGGRHHSRPTPAECAFEYLKRCEDVARTYHALCNFVAHPVSEPLFFKVTETWTMPRLMVVGHTHKRALFWIGDGCRQDDIEIGCWYNLPGDTEQCLLVNPGSVGFPRESWGDYCASYALLDWDERHPRISFHRVPYNRPATIRHLDEQQYPPEIKKHLSGKCAFAHSNNCLCATEF